MCTGCGRKTRTQFVLRICNTTANAEINFTNFTLTLHSASKNTVTSQNVLRVFECIVEFDQATNRLRHARFSSAFCPILPERLGADDPNFSRSERQPWPPERPTSSSPSGSNQATSAAIRRPIRIRATHACTTADSVWIDAPERCPAEKRIVVPETSPCHGLSLSDRESAFRSIQR